jgi:hypothetical protein
VNRKALAAAALAAGIGLLAAGCGGSADGAAATKSGTETISGTLTGAQAMATNPVFHLTLKGPVNTTANLPLGTTSPKKGQARTIKTSAGNLVIVGGTPASTQKLLSTKTCRFAFGTTLPYTVDGGKSTGQFAGATGNGKAALLLQADLPKLSDGKCDTSSTAQPVPSSALATFKAAGPLTLK